MKTWIPTTLAWLVLLALVAAGGCDPEATGYDLPAPIPSQPRPEQEAMTWDEYPEWAKKGWVLLVFVESRTAVESWNTGGIFSRRVSREVYHPGEYYYIDRDSFDPEEKLYVTIGNEMLSVGNRPHRITETKVRNHFEGGSERGYLFPCTKPGKWHTYNMEGSSGTVFSKCPDCARYCLQGRIEFQVETGDIHWRMY